MDIHLNYPTVKLSSQELAAFEKSSLIIADLLTLDRTELTRRSGIPVGVILLRSSYVGRGIAGNHR